MRPTYFTFACPNCNTEFGCEYTPGIPAQIYGPPERCYEAEPATVSVEYCPTCDFALDYDSLCEAGAEARQEAIEEAAEYKAESMKDPDRFNRDQEDPA